MIRSIQRRYFEVWGNEEAQNAFLKGLLVVMTALLVTQGAALTALSLRKPVLIGIGTAESRVFAPATPTADLTAIELKRLVRAYVEAHYNWDEATIENAQENAARYVSEKFQKVFASANADQVKFAHEKKVTERVYLASEIVTDPATLTARINLDRIFTVGGIRATSPLILDVSFEYGPRTAANPEGIYITGEKVLTQP